MRVSGEIPNSERDDARETETSNARNCLRTGAPVSTERGSELPSNATAEIAASFAWRRVAKPGILS